MHGGRNFQAKGISKKNSQKNRWEIASENAEGILEELQKQKIGWTYSNRTTEEIIWKKTLVSK